MNKRTIPATDEAWEDGLLGKDEAFVKVADVEVEAAIDEAAGTQAISIRLPKAMINDMKVIAAHHKGIGYQTLMKQILQRFIDCEKRQIWNEYVAQKIKEQSTEAQPAEKPAARPKSGVKLKKAA